MAGVNRSAYDALEFDRSTYHHMSVAPVRLPSNRPSRNLSCPRSLAFAAAVVGFTSCRVVNASIMGKRPVYRELGLQWRNNTPTGGSRPSSAMTGGRPR